MSFKLGKQPGSFPVAMPDRCHEEEPVCGALPPRPTDSVTLSRLLNDSLIAIFFYSAFHISVWFFSLAFQLASAKAALALDAIVRRSDVKPRGARNVRQTINLRIITRN